MSLRVWSIAVELYPSENSTKQKSAYRLLGQVQGRADILKTK